MASKEVVLMTGSSGRIGTALVRRLSPRYEIIGLDQAGPPYPASPARCLPLDIESDESVGSALDRVREAYGSRVASVIHLAAYYSFTGDPDPRYYTVNVLGTRRLLRALQNFDVEQFIFSSSMIVHALRAPGQPIDEDSPFDPKWEYPKSKIEAENVIRSEHGRIPYIVLRIAGVYDEQCHLPTLAQQIQRIHERRLISRVFPGDSAHGQAAVHIDDLTDALSLALAKRDVLPHELALLIGEPETYSYAAIQSELGRPIHGEPWETREIPKAVAKTGAWLQEIALPKEEEPFIKHWMIDIADDHYELDITRARHLLGWSPRYKLLESLPQMIHALKTDPVAWYKTNKLDAPPDLAQRAKPATKEASCPTPIKTAG